MALAFDWMYRDPAEVVDRLRATRERLAKADKEMAARERRIKARRIRKLVKLAKKRQLKGQQG